MRQHVDIRPLTDRQRLQRFERQIVPAFDDAIIGLDDDALVYARSLELLVHDLGGAFDIGDATGCTALGKGGNLDLDVFCMRQPGGKGRNRHGGEESKRFGHDN